MVLMLLWLYFMMPFLASLWTHRNFKCASQLLINSLNCLQVNAVSLSVNILFIKNHLQLTNDADEVLPLQWPPYCETGGTTINKRQKMSTIIMGHVHCQPTPVFLHAQIPFFLMNWCWINWLAGFTGSDYQFNKFFGYRWVDNPHKVQCPLNAWVATLLVNDFCLIGSLQRHNFQASVHLLSCADQVNFVALWWGCQHNFDWISPVLCPSSACTPLPNLTVPKRYLTGILPAAFVFTCTFPVRVSDTHGCTHTESVTTCNTCICIEGPDWLHNNPLIK